MKITIRFARNFLQGSVRTYNLSSICSIGGELSSNTNKKVKRMPGSARMGLTLLLIGAILVGVGTYVNRGAFSLYGLILVIIGFSTYMISSIIVARRKRK